MRVKYGENSETLMICASGNLEDFGEVTSASQEITSMLGYSPEDVVGLDVSKIIPQNLADIHTGIMKEYFETGVNHFVNLERLIFPQRNDGYIMPSNGLLRIMPYLDKGIEMVVFFKPSSQSIFQDHGIVITDPNGLLVGVNKLLYQLFGVQPNCCYGRSRYERAVTLQSMLPNFGETDLANMQIGQKISTVLDTSCLRSNVMQKAEEDELSSGDKVKSRTVILRPEDLRQGFGDAMEMDNEPYESDELQRLKRYPVELSLWDQHVLGGGLRTWNIFSVKHHNPLPISQTFNDASASVIHEEIIMSNPDIQASRSINKKHMPPTVKEEAVAASPMNIDQRNQSGTKYGTSHGLKLNKNSSSGFSSFRSRGGSSFNETTGNTMSGKFDNSSYNESDLHAKTSPQQMSKQIREAKKFLAKRRTPRIAWGILAAVLVLALYSISVSVYNLLTRMQWNDDFMKLINSISPVYGLLSLVNQSTAELNMLYLLVIGQITPTTAANIKDVTSRIEAISEEAQSYLRGFVSLKAALLSMSFGTFNVDDIESQVVLLSSIRNGTATVKSVDEQVLSATDEYFNQLAVFGTRVEDQSSPSDSMLQRMVQPFSTLNVINKKFYYLITNGPQAYRMKLESILEYLTVGLNSQISFNSYFDYISILLMLIVCMYIILKFIMIVIALQNKSIHCLFSINKSDLSKLTKSARIFISQLDDYTVISSNNRIKSLLDIRDIDIDQPKQLISPSPIKVKINDVGVASENDPLPSTERRFVFTQPESKVGKFNSSPKIERNPKKRETEAISPAKDQENFVGEHLSAQITNQAHRNYLTKIVLGLVPALVCLAVMLVIEVMDINETKDTLINMNKVFKLKSDILATEGLLFEAGRTLQIGRQQF